MSLSNSGANMKQASAPLARLRKASDPKLDYSHITVCFFFPICRLYRTHWVCSAPLLLNFLFVLLFSSVVSVVSPWYSQCLVHKYVTSHVSSFFVLRYLCPAFSYRYSFPSNEFFVEWCQSKVVLFRGLRVSFISPCYTAKQEYVLTLLKCM